MSEISMREFCLRNNLEVQFFKVLESHGIIQTEKKNTGRVMVGSSEVKKLQEGEHYVTCPVCGQKRGALTAKHYKVCCVDKPFPKPLYSNFVLKHKVKTTEQRERQSEILKQRFKTSEGEITREKITRASRNLNSDPSFLKRKSKISKEVQNRLDSKSVRSEKSKEMWNDAQFRQKKEAYVEENIKDLRKSAARARSFLKKTSALHIRYKETLLREGIKGFVTEYEAGPYSIDEADPLAKIAIEIDGCYWHGCRKCNYPGDPRIIRIDRRKEGYLKKRGWLLIRISEHEIQENEKICVEMIKTLQKRRREFNRKKIKESFVNGYLCVESFHPDGSIRWKPISDVVRHRTPHKKMLQVNTNRASVCVTEDHSLFSWKKKKEVLTKNLEAGQEIIGCENHEASPFKIHEINEKPPQEHTYDVSVPGTENAVLSSGVVVHNTYSISGVSLDVEKSAKYESMKNNFIQEYDKLKEQAKRSIKVIKGLQMPRYGIGISSALGPFSSPGVQSRRNWVSGFRGG